MANEDRQLEDILVETPAPERVDDREKKPKKVAKLTNRTISSLKTKIKENRVSKAYAKYNKKYQQMKKALINAEEVRVAKSEGKDITDSELSLEYDVVASYSKKLAKMGAQLLEEDITKVASVGSLAKPIRVPRFLANKLHGLTSTIVRIREKKKIKKLQKEEAKEIRKGTEQYIKSSLESALYKNVEERNLREQVDADVIKNLSLKGGKDGTERRLDTLRGFISKDGKEPIFKTSEEDELEKNIKNSVDLPPTKPAATANKEEPKINVNDLIKGLMDKKTVAEEVVIKEEVENKKSDVVNVDDLIKKTESKIEEPEKTIVNPQKDEQATTITHGHNIDELLEQLKNSETDEERKKIQDKIADEKKELDKIVRNVKRKTKTTPKTVEEKSDNLEPIEVEPDKSVIKEEPKVEEESSEKVVIKDTQKDVLMENVTMKNNETVRAEQIQKPLALRVTLQDIKKLEERNKAAQQKIAVLQKEKAELEEQKAMLKQYIEQAQVTRDNELQAQNMAKDNATLKGEVAELSSEAAAIDSSLGRTK